MNSRWTFFGCVFSALMLQAQPEPVVVEGIAAVVGKNIILVSDWDQQIQSVGQQRQSMGEDAPSDCQVFEDMLFEKLLIHQAEIDSIEVGEDEVESTIDRRIAMLTEQIGSQRKMEEYYNKSTIEIKEEMRELVQDQLLAQRMQATKARRGGCLFFWVLDGDLARKEIAQGHTHALEHLQQQEGLEELNDG